MRRLAIACLALVVAAGCARSGTGIGDGDSAPPPTRVTTAPGGGWTTSQADVTAVRPGPDARSATLTVSVLAGCSRDPRITYYTEENGNVYANVVQDVRGNDVVGACPSHEPAEVELRSKTPLAARTLVLNQQAWAPAADGTTYRRCSETLGCHPPADHCDTVWVRAAVAGMDVSRHSTGHVEDCADPWLVMTVPDDPAACGAAPRAGCDASTTTRRYFLRFAGDGWQIEARATGAGCAGAPADFPPDMCARLTAPGK